MQFFTNIERELELKEIMGLLSFDRGLSFETPGLATIDNQMLGVAVFSPSIAFFYELHSKAIKSVMKKDGHFKVKLEISKDTESIYIIYIEGMWLGPVTRKLAPINPIGETEFLPSLARYYEPISVAGLVRYSPMKENHHV